jgi:hypothetical protein
MALQPLWALASFSVSWSILFTIGRTPWMSDQLIARPLPKLWMGNDRKLCSRGPLGAWDSLTCSKFTTWVKQLKVPPGGLVPWIFPSLKIRRPPPGLNPRRSIHEVGTLPLDYGGRYIFFTY